MIQLSDIETAAHFVHGHLSPTPQIAWPLLAEATGCDLWVKHENHLPTGSFKVRGGLVYFAWLRNRHPEVQAVIAATRGNFGQSIGFAARQFGMPATIVVPHGNSREKNAAMRALGVELIEEGHDFQAAFEYALGLAGRRGLHMVRSFNQFLVLGSATYGLELFRAVSDLDTVYVPIGMGSGICGVIAARHALGLSTRIVGVVAEGAPAYALSFRNRELVATDRAETIADGLACRTPDPEALAIMFHGMERVVLVSEEAIRHAMRLYFTATHNVAEGAAAAALAALLSEREPVNGKRVAVILSGGNVDREVYCEVLREC